MRPSLGNGSPSSPFSRAFLSGSMLFFLGFFVGIIMTAPVGGVNILCLRKSLRFGFKAGMMVALGAVLADAIFAGVAIFGIGFIADLINQHAQLIQFIGGIVVLLFAVAILRQKIDLDAVADYKSDPGGPFSAFLITITNPGTIFGFIALFSALGEFLPPPSSVFGALVLILGVVAGCLFWWCFVAGLAARYRHKISTITLSRINKGTGFFLILFGIFVLVRAAVVGL